MGALSGCLTSNQFELALNWLERLRQVYQTEEVDSNVRLIKVKYPTHQVEYGCVKYNEDNDGMGTV